MEEAVLGKRIYISNLSFRCSWQTLKDTFRECGNVVYADVPRDRRGQSRGWGIIEFETPEEALTAIQTMQNREIEGRPVTIREDRMDRDLAQFNQDGARPTNMGGGGGGGGAGGGGGGGRGGGRGPAPGRGEGAVSSGLQVVVQGLPWAYKWTDLKDLFANEGFSVVRADIAERGGRSRGFGTVRFETAEAANKAIAVFNERDLEGRKLGVKMDQFA